MPRARREYRGVLGRRARRRCPHSDLVAIYGDEVNAVGGWRLFCRACARFLDGPARLARLRSMEAVDE